MDPPPKMAQNAPLREADPITPPDVGHRPPPQPFQPSMETPMDLPTLQQSPP